MALGAVAPIPSAVSAGVGWLDTAAHVCEYLLLAWCLSRTARAAACHPARAVPVVLLLSVGYGLLLEGVQGWLPYRAMEGTDLLANVLGACVGLWLGRWNSLTPVGILRD